MNTDSENQPPKIGRQQFEVGLHRRHIRPALDLPFAIGYRLSWSPTLAMSFCSSNAPRNATILETHSSTVSSPVSSSISGFIGTSYGALTPVKSRISPARAFA